MFFTSTEAAAAEPVKSGWDQFWQAVIDFFFTKDNSGLNYLTRVCIAVGIIVVGYFLIKLICHILRRGLGVKKRGLDVDLNARYFAVSVLKVLMWVGVAILVVAVLKIDVSGIVGITSAVTVALGLALQDLIMGFASGVVILHQHHIATGEYIGVTNSFGTQEGTVVKVQVFFTFLKTPGGQEVTIPNSNMLKATITNYTRSGERRIDYNVGVSYDADIEKAKKVLLKLVEGDPRIKEGTTPTAYVYELGAYSVGVRLRVMAKQEEYWNMYNELGEKVLLAFRKNHIHIPSSTEIEVSKKKD